MVKVFNNIFNDREKMAKVMGSPFREAAFFALYDFVKEGGDLLELPWFAAVKSARRENIKEKI